GRARDGPSAARDRVAAWGRGMVAGGGGRDAPGVAVSEYVDERGRVSRSRRRGESMNMDVLVSLSKRRGFVFQLSEIYGGTGSCWDYGPLGVELKNNIKRVWWRDFVQARADMVGIDASILMHPTVW